MLTAQENAHLAALNKAFSQMSGPLLREANRICVAHIRHKSREAVYSFRYGDLVEFDCKRTGRVEQGKVVKVAISRVDVQTSSQTWIVPASALRKIEALKPTLMDAMRAKLGSSHPALSRV